MRQLPSQSHFLACRPGLSHGIPFHPMKNPNALGGASGVHAGWSGEPAGSGGPVGR
jgi:hypothetical protein